MQVKKDNKLNWNGLTEDEQKFVEHIVNKEVLTGCNQLISKLNELGDYIEFVNDYNEEEDEFTEVFVYFIVSDWLYEELNKIGAVTAEYEGLYIWGRTDFGQGLDMNHELKEIAQNVVKRRGF